jgi:hypothetical protein
MPITPTVVIALLCGTLVSVPAAVAQQVAPPDNARLRLTLTPKANAPPGHVIGWLDSFDQSTISMRDHRGHISTTDRAKVTKVEQSQGRHSRWRRVGIGFAVGMAGGALIGLGSGEDCANSGGFGGPCFSPGATAAMLGMFFGGIGAAVGAVLPPGERWTATGFPAPAVPPRP